MYILKYLKKKKKEFTYKINRFIYVIFNFQKYNFFFI